jgi:ribosomal protein S18 acetylase RimI-like enzyme
MDEKSNTSVKRLSREDAAAFREVRLDGLSKHPEAFGASLADEQKNEVSFFADRLDKGVVFGGYLNNRLSGVVGFFQEAAAKKQHKGLIWGMYVREDARGTGLASKLVDQVLDYAQPLVEQVHLTVVSSNEAARRLYERKGLVTYGVEPNALCVD